MVSQFLIVIGNIIANYRLLGQDDFISETIVIEMPMKLKNYYKNQPILIFAPYNFLIFLDTQLHEPKISRKTITVFFW